MRLTRRAFVRASGAVVVAGTAAQGVPVRAQVLTEPEPKIVGWTRVKTLVERGQYWSPNGPTREEHKEQIWWTTLMRVSDKGLASTPLDSWYLWFWTHDAPIARLYVGPAPTGDFRPWDGGQGLCTFQTFSTVDGQHCHLPTPMPPPQSLYDPNSGGFPRADRYHFATADVVWDGVTGYFYATPHVMWCGGRAQPNLVVRSTDGIHWTHFAPDVRYPALNIGASGAFDHYSANYPRILRDYGGNVVRVDGRVVMYYRGTRETGTHPEEHFNIGAATSTDLIAWQKHPTCAAGDRLFDLSSDLEFRLGSALWVNGRAHLVHAFGGLTMYLKTASAAGDPFAFSSGLGTPIYQLSGSADIDGGSYVIDNGTHYFTYRMVTPPPNTVDSRHRVELASAL